MIKKIILVWFDNILLSESLLWSNINKGKYIHDTKTNIYLREYTHYFTQLYKNDWVFFDYLFESIEKWLNDNNNIENSDKTRESWIMDCYPTLIHRVNDLMMNLQWCLIISNSRNNKYDYLIDLLQVKKITSSSESDVIYYLKNFKNLSM